MFALIKKGDNKIIMAVVVQTVTTMVIKIQNKQGPELLIGLLYIGW